MTDYNARLQELQDRITHLERQEAMLSSFYDQETELQRRERELLGRREAERADVDQLEGRTLYALFCAVLGRREEKLEQERREALEAAIRHDAVVKEMEAVRADIRMYRGAREELRKCQGEYDRVLAEKKATLKERDPVNGPEICRMEQELAALVSWKKELREALSAGRNALSAAESIGKSLSSAKNWSTWDMVGGGGIVTQMAKHGHLDDAQHKIESLQAQLRRFRTELADVRIQGELQARAGDFLRFADWFFDGLFVDWAVMDQINRSQSQVSGVASQLRGVISRLEGMVRQTEAREGEIQTRLQSLVKGL